jgi:DNA-binding response OmpR family regulator
MMPELIRLEMCAALRGAPTTAQLPIIILTAKAQDADITRGRATGSDDYIVKPFSPRELPSRVQAVPSGQHR